MPKLCAHLFICTSCTYTLDNGETSSEDEAIKLRKNLKNKVVEKFGKDKARVSAVTCLGECESGIASVLYPGGEWQLGLRPSDELALFEKIAAKI